MLYELRIGGVLLNPTVPPDAVKRAGGGRAVQEQVTITGRIVRSLGHVTARRVTISSPGQEWALLTEQVHHLRALESNGEPFTVVLGPGYEVSGEFQNCWFDGDVLLEPKRVGDGLYSNYAFTLYLPQGGTP